MLQRLRVVKARDRGGAPAATVRLPVSATTRTTERHHDAPLPLLSPVTNDRNCGQQKRPSPSSENRSMSRRSCTVGTPTSRQRARSRNAWLETQPSPPPVSRISIDWKRAASALSVTLAKNSLSCTARRSLSSFGREDSAAPIWLFNCRPSVFVSFATTYLSLYPYHPHLRITCKLA